MKKLGIITVLAALFVANAGAQSLDLPNYFVDSNSNIYMLYPMATYPRPVLLYLDCRGAQLEDLDTALAVYDSLGWNVVVCGKSRNHRAPRLNESDIINLDRNLRYFPQIDTNRIVLFGFSGQGAQAWGTGLRYPRLFAGIITECAHTGLIYSPDIVHAGHLHFIIITREDDWNRDFNEMMYEALRDVGIDAHIIITPGEHHIGDSSELYNACKLMDSLLEKQ
ncbi:hypothetical protein J7K99_00020 [bacterium]|nr:hypothetical protein [bacterium]